MFLIFSLVFFGSLSLHVMSVLCVFFYTEFFWILFGFWNLFLQVLQGQGFR